MTTHLRPPKPPRPEPVPRVRSCLIDRLAPEDVPMFWDRIAQHLPLVEAVESSAPGEGPGEVVVTFCWRDRDAEQVLLFANRLTDETQLADTLLERHGDTDLWHASFRMRADWRASYAFLIKRPGEPAPWVGDGHVGLRAALDRGLPDPRNPDSCENRAGTRQSVVSLPDAPEQRWLSRRLDVPAGAVVRHEGPDGREVWLYDPADVPADVPLPLVVALDGEVWTSRQSLPTTLDNLIADGMIPPVRAVLPSSGDRETRWAELGNDGGSTYVADELVPWTRTLRAVEERVVVVGQSLGGLTALRVGLARPDVVRGVASQSASLWLDDLAELVRAGVDTRIHLAWGLQEWVLDAPHRALADQLVEAGIDVEAAPVNGGHDYAWWRGTVADGLRALLG
ncbi:enterochelin esterase domain-containing protein [Nocardioides sp. DS6]|uniref:Enterochelin esterase domain-containing protein n=1 Tax=Nocardioides eburneus TaxID=3231482 RepID=A0ABV3SVQ2_9ACTN